MPQIKLVIDPANKKPVEFSGKIQNGWKCPKTNKLFTTKKRYITHLKRFAKERLAQRKLDLIEQARKKFWQDAEKSILSVTDLENFLRDNWEKVCYEMWRKNKWRYPANKEFKMLPEMQLKYLRITNLRFRPHISNSHCCPRNGVTNWIRDVNKPSGYPGWTGDISYQMVGGYGRFFENESDAFQELNVHTGSGGYAGNYYYNITLFADDFPTWATMMALTS